MPRSAEALRVKLLEPLSAPAPQPELRMPEDTPPKAVSAPLQRSVPEKRVEPRAPLLAARPSASGSRALVGEAARKAAEQISRQLFYPPEAIVQGLEGETLVLLFLDEAGNVIAARIEGSSGHPILDEAAVRAARTLRSLPASAPREAVIPVRFKLN